VNRVVRKFGRGLLRAWGRTGRVHGYFYRTMETIGSILAESQPLTSRLPDGSRMECDLRDEVQRQIYFQGVYEPIETFLFTRLIHPCATIIDVGANVGQYTLLASSATGPRGAVHSFEPVPRNFNCLRRHVEANRLTNVYLNPIALWHEATELSLGLPTRRENAGAYSVGSAVNSTVPVITTRAVRLDDYVTERCLPRIDLIKMDIEGAEWGALQGMSKVLGRDRPLILMEVLHETCARLGYDPVVFWKYLVGDFGYTAWRIGTAATEWRVLSSAAELDRPNVLFCVGGLPSEIVSGWDIRRCLRWGGGGGGRR
jgi:FkbM family methyltransferase